MYICWSAQMDHKPVSTSSAKQAKVLRAYCPNIYIYTVSVSHLWVNFDENSVPRNKTENWLFFPTWPGSMWIFKNMWEHFGFYDRHSWNIFSTKVLKKGKYLAKTHVEESYLKVSKSQKHFSWKNERNIRQNSALWSKGRILSNIIGQKFA